jgi:hypothetical protein
MLLFIENPFAFCKFRFSPELHAAFVRTCTLTQINVFIRT